VNRVGRDVRIAIFEVDIYHDEVVDVIEMVTDLICSDLACNASDNKVSRSAAGDLVGHVRWYVELSVAPTEFKLAWSASFMPWDRCISHPLHVQIYVITLGISKEVGRSFDEGYRCRSVIAEEYVKQSAATNNAGQVLMCRTFRKVGD